jgi:hypothetical protein
LTLARVGARVEKVSVANLLETRMALVEADEGIAIIPSFGPAVRAGVASLDVQRSTTTSRVGCEQQGRTLPSAGLSSGSGP